MDTLNILLRRTLYRSLICAIVCHASPNFAYCQKPQLRGIVVTVGGKPLSHVEVRIVGVTTSLTTDSGEFQITLPEKLGPGTPILIQVKNWVVINPYDGGSGRTYVHRDSSEPIRVVVGHKGDSAVLADSTVIQDIVQQAVRELSVRTGNIDRGLVSETAFLNQRAEELGFTVDQLKKAISSWAERVEGPYQRALVAVYGHRYLEADKLLGESISASQTDLVNKFVVHATVERKLGNYRQAESLLEKAQTLDPVNRVVRLRLAGVLADQAKYSEARALYLSLLETDQSHSPSLNSDSLEAAQVLNNLGQLEFYVGDFKSARERFEQTLSLTKNLLGPEHAAVAAVLGNIAELDREEGKFPEAEQLYREALRLAEILLWE
jgi:tetratricopeptide (TPR) repeat protein